MLKIRDWNKNYETHRTRGVRQFAWIAFPTRMDGEGFIALLRHEKGVVYWGIWTILLMLAAKSPVRGCLVYRRSKDGSMTYLAHDSVTLSKVIGVGQQLVAEAIDHLISLTWLELGDIKKICGNDLNPALHNNTIQDKHNSEAAPYVAETEAWFESVLWPMYPRKKKRGQALSAAVKHIRSQESREKCMKALEAALPEMLAREERYRPYLSAWINQGCWQDPIEQDPAPRKADFGPQYPQL